MATDPSESTEHKQEPPADLPAVKPPTTGFFLQLFVLPAVIVFGIMLVWFLFGKLAHNDRSVEGYVEAIKSGGGERWKAAHDLTHLLRSGSVHTKNLELAVSLKGLLENQLATEETEENGRRRPRAAEPDDEERLRLVEYLCGALGCFEFTIGVPALRRAAEPEQPFLIRKAALVSIARLADQLGDVDDPNVVPEVVEYSREDDQQVREVATYTLGFLDDSRSVSALKAALNDPSVHVRINASVALASHGDEAAIPALSQLLDVAQLAEQFQTEGSSTEEASVEKARLTVAVALAALKRLAERNPNADLSSIRTSVERLAGDESGFLRVRAKEVLVAMPGEASTAQ
ncbi:HEAT repeat domain-containing protein [Kolteria novifilia]